MKYKHKYNGLIVELVFNDPIKETIMYSYISERIHPLEEDREVMLEDHYEDFYSVYEKIVEYPYPNFRTFYNKVHEQD